MVKAGAYKTKTLHTGESRKKMRAEKKAEVACTVVNVR
jgi:hypothetical protein